MSTADPALREPLYRDLLAQVSALRASMLKLESETLPRVGEVKPGNLESARNLSHYMALRRADLRNLQERLASVGLSSLGRSEAHVLATVDEVAGILAELVHGPVPARRPASLSYEAGRTLLKKNADELLGASPKHRTVRIMVTMPTEAARDYGLVEGLLTAGMNLMRINCAHDDPPTWTGMIENLKRARSATGRECRLIMDIPGPKLRTGPIEPGPKVKKVRPGRSQTGAVVAPALVVLSTGSEGASSQRIGELIPLEARVRLRGTVKPGDRLRFRDARDAGRSLTVVDVGETSITAELRKTAYFETGQAVTLRRGDDEELLIGSIGEMAPMSVPLLLKMGDRLLIPRSPELGRPATRRVDGSIERSARISCTVPQVIASVKPGESIWFDDGRIGGVVIKVDQDGALVNLLRAARRGEAGTR